MELQENGIIGGKYIGTEFTNKEWSKVFDYINYWFYKKWIRIFFFFQIGKLWIFGKKDREIGGINRAITSL